MSLPSYSKLLAIALFIPARLLYRESARLIFHTDLRSIFQLRRQNHLVIGRSRQRVIVLIYKTKREIGAHSASLFPRKAGAILKDPAH